MDGEKIRKIRVLLDMSQADLAELFGISPTTWNRYENGHTKPNKWLCNHLRILEIVAKDPRNVGELTALRRDDVEVPALLWFVLDKAYRSRFSA